MYNLRPPYFGDEGSWDLRKFQEFSGVGWDGVHGGLWGHKSAKLTVSLSSAFYHKWKIRSSAADSVCISGFWGRCPEPQSALDPVGGTFCQSPMQLPGANPTSKSWLHHWLDPLSASTYCDPTCLLVGWFVRLLVCLFVSSRPATCSCNGRWAVSGSAVGLRGCSRLAEVAPYERFYKFYFCHTKHRSNKNSNA